MKTAERMAEEWCAEEIAKHGEIDPVAKAAYIAAFNAAIGLALSAIMENSAFASLPAAYDRVKRLRVE